MTINSKEHQSKGEDKLYKQINSMIIKENL